MIKTETVKKIKRRKRKQITFPLVLDEINKPDSDEDYDADILPEPVIEAKKINLKSAQKIITIEAKKDG